MEYIEITVKVPVGYEDRVRKTVQTVVEGILSQLILSPTAAKKAEYDSNVSLTKDFNIKKK